MLALPAVVSGQPSRSGVLRHVNVVDVGSGVVLEDRTLVWVRGMISEIKPDGMGPIARREVDARGRFLVPGLWDLHVHQAQRIWRGVGLEENASYFHPLFLAAGVTGVRDMGGDLATLVKWRGETARGLRLAPWQVVTGEKLGQQPVVPGAPFPLTSQGAFDRSVDLLKLGGADFIKVSELSDQELDWVASAAQRSGLAFAGHVSPFVGVQRADAHGMHTIEHLTDVLLSASSQEQRIRASIAHPTPTLWEKIYRKVTGRAPDEAEVVAARSYDPNKMKQLAITLAQHGRGVVPTLRLTAVRLHVRAASTRMPPGDLLIRDSESRDGDYANSAADSLGPLGLVWRTSCRSVGALLAEGVAVLAGTDAASLFAVPGASLVDELELLVQCGATPVGALRAVTRDAARFVGQGAVAGSVAVGKRADLVLTDENPLLNIGALRKVRGVVVQGRFLPKSSLDSLVGVAVATVARNRSRFGAER